MLTLAQCLSFILLKNITSFWTLFILAYFIGGVANHALMLAIHEISHNQGFGPTHPLANRILGMIANLPIGVPTSISFRKYHLEHHRYQGDEVLDTDIPSNFEVSFFTNSFLKFFWCLFQPFFYTIRPLFMHPKPITYLEFINLLVQLSFDIIIVKYLGWHVIAYMIGSSLLSMGLHPVAGHFISEHFLMFDNKQPINTDITSKGECRNNNDNRNITLSDDGTFLIPETCSYYGPLNWVTFNVGYHVEHHDFPSIPGSRLYRLQEIAPEFYLTLHYHTSWSKVIWQYITDHRVGPAARVRRPAREVSEKELY